MRDFVVQANHRKLGFLALFAPISRDNNPPIFGDFGNPHRITSSRFEIVQRVAYYRCRIVPCQEALNIFKQWLAKAFVEKEFLRPTQAASR